MPLADFDALIHGLTGHNGAIDELMRLIADDLVYGAAVVLALLWVHRDGLRAGAAIAAGALVALGIGQVLSAVLPEARPFVTDHFTPLIAHPADGSFPSDHLLVLGALVGGSLRASRPLSLVAASMALLVAVARVYVGVHHPVDVVVGFAVGLACGLVAWRVIGKAAPLLDRLDSLLQRLHLRPVVLGRRYEGSQAA